MNRMSWRWTCAVVVCGAGMIGGREAAAQSLSGGVPGLGGASYGSTGGGSGYGSAGGSSGYGSAGVGPGYGSAGVGASSPVVQTMPTGVPFFSSTVPDTTGNLSGVPSTSSGQGNLFNNPMVAPILYNSMLQAGAPGGLMGATGTTATTGTTTTGTTAATGASRMLYGPTGMNTMGLGMLLLANQQQNGGIGSGQMSGTRANPRQQATASSATGAGPKPRTAARPGGLASRYFNRPTSHPTYPQRYFNRQTRYFP